MFYPSTRTLNTLTSQTAATRPRKTPRPRANSIPR
jgi:hypothetical protein